MGRDARQEEVDLRRDFREERGLGRVQGGFGEELEVLGFDFSLLISGGSGGVGLGREKVLEMDRVGDERTEEEG